MNNIKEIKTTVLGLIFIVSGLIYFFKGDYNQITFAALEAAGVMLMLAPDKIINIVLDKYKNK